MSASQNLKLTRFVKILLDVILGLLIFVCVFLVLWIALSPLVLNVIDVPIMPCLLYTSPSPRDRS